MSSSPWTMLCSASAGKHRARRVNISTNNTRYRQTTLDKVSIFMAKTKVYFLCASHWTICNTWCCRLPYFFSISLPFLSGQYAFLVVFLFCILFKYLYPVMFHLILFSFFFCQMLPSFANTHSMLLILKPVSRQTTVTKCTEGRETCLVLGIQSEKTPYSHPAALFLCLSRCTHSPVCSTCLDSAYITAHLGNYKSFHPCIHHPFLPPQFIISRNHLS